MEMITVTAKTVEDAITQASLQLGVSSDRIQYEVVEKGSAGVLGGLFGSKPAVIRAKKIETVDDKAVDFLNSVFDAMGLAVDVEVKMNEEEKEMDVNLTGEEMGLLIGKRGQTLDSLQYLVSLVVNKESEDYLRVKLDTENYRERRKETLETLAKNIAYKVKRTRRPVSLEPMNPVDLTISLSLSMLLKIILHISVGRLICQSTDGTRTERLSFTEDNLRVIMGAALVFTREV